MHTYLHVNIYYVPIYLLYSMTFVCKVLLIYIMDIDHAKYPTTCTHREPCKLFCLRHWNNKIFGLQTFLLQSIANILNTYYYCKQNYFIIVQIPYKRLNSLQASYRKHAYLLSILCLPLQDLSFHHDILYPYTITNSSIVDINRK